MGNRKRDNLLTRSSNPPKDPVFFLSKIQLKPKPTTTFPVHPTKNAPNDTTNNNYNNKLKNPQKSM